MATFQARDVLPRTAQFSGIRRMVKFLFDLLLSNISLAFSIGEGHDVELQTLSLLTMMFSAVTPNIIHHSHWLYFC